MQWHDWLLFWTLEHCLSGYGFSHSPIFCRQISDTSSISITSYSHMHPRAVRVEVSTLQVHQLNLKHFWALLSLSVLYMMTCAWTATLQANACLVFYSILGTVQANRSFDICRQYRASVWLKPYPLKQCSSAHNHHQSCHCITFTKPSLSCILFYLHHLDITHF